MRSEEIQGVRRETEREKMQSGRRYRTREDTEPDEIEKSLPDRDGFFQVAL